MKMFDYNAKRGEWCKPLVDNIFKIPGGRELEIGMYVEPDDGTYTVGTHYPNLSILDCFKGETFKRYKMDYCNTCVKIVKE